MLLEPAEFQKINIGTIVNKEVVNILYQMDVYRLEKKIGKKEEIIEHLPKLLETLQKAEKRITQNFLLLLKNETDLQVMLFV